MAGIETRKHLSQQKYKQRGVLYLERGVGDHLQDNKLKALRSGAETTTGCLLYPDVSVSCAIKVTHPTYLKSGNDRLCRYSLRGCIGLQLEENILSMTRPVGYCSILLLYQVYIRHLRSLREAVRNQMR